MFNPSNKSYIIKNAKGLGQIMTEEHSKTVEGKAALAFAEAAGEEITLMDTDKAIDTFLLMCEEGASKNAVH